jgi:hypothetical protein
VYELQGYYLNNALQVLGYSILRLSNFKTLEEMDFRSDIWKERISSLRVPARCTYQLILIDEFYHRYTHLAVMEIVASNIRLNEKVGKLSRRKQ